MPVTTVYQVTGMTCGHCEAAVSGELRRLPGVRHVSVELPTGNVTVTSDAALPVAQVRAAIDEAGYELVGDHD